MAILPELDEVDEIEHQPRGPAHRHLPLLRAPAASTSTRPTPPCASPTCRAASWWSARTSARSTRTARAPWRCCKARLLAAEQEKQQSAQAQSRRLQVGSGDRSERIRTYNFPQGRVTDHRINLTLYKLAQVMDGDLDELIDALQQEHQAELLAEEA